MICRLVLAKNRHLVNNFFKLINSQNSTFLDISRHFSTFLDISRRVDFCREMSKSVVGGDLKINISWHFSMLQMVDKSPWFCYKLGFCYDSTLGLCYDRLTII